MRVKDLHKMIKLAHKKGDVKILIDAQFYEVDEERCGFIIDDKGNLTLIITPEKKD